MRTFIVLTKVGCNIHINIHYLCRDVLRTFSSPFWTPKTKKQHTITVSITTPGKIQDIWLNNSVWFTRKIGIIFHFVVQACTSYYTVIFLYLLPKFNLKSKYCIEDLLVGKILNLFCCFFTYFIITFKLTSKNSFCINDI